MKKILIFILFFFNSNLYAEDLFKTLSNAFKNNSKLNAERASLNAVKQDINISRGEFLPSITLSGDAATQKDTNRKNQQGISLQKTHSEPENRSVIVEQKIFDGFSNYNDLEKSKLEFKYAEFKLNKLEQDVILSAAKAYYDLGYNFKNLEFNQSNVELFERQVESDRARLERGEINLTDFAQSESSLAGALAKLITAENELISGKKNFQKIIGSIAPSEINLGIVPNLKIPTSLNTAIAISDQINPRLNLAKIDLEIAKKELYSARGDLSPSASISYQRKKNYDLSSTIDEREQEEVKATVKWPLFKGGKNISSVKKVSFKLKEKKLILKDISDQVQIDTANAWTLYNSTKSVLEATSVQLKAAEIANEGITLEYESGNRRSTLEVIQSRTLLLDARTSFAKAQKDFAIAQFNFLASIGDLYLENIK